MFRKISPNTLFGAAAALGSIATIAGLLPALAVAAATLLALGPLTDWDSGADVRAVKAASRQHSRRAA